MKGYHPLDRRRRARGAMATIVLLLGGLVAVFFRVQVVRSSTWMLRSENNRLRPLPIPAPRGTIFDREGRVLADNVPAYSISVLPAPADSIRRPHPGQVGVSSTDSTRSRSANFSSFSVPSVTSPQTVSTSPTRRSRTRSRKRFVGSNAAHVTDPASSARRKKT